MDIKTQQVLTSPSLSGELSSFSLAHILKLLNLCGSNGILQIKKGALYGVMYIENGQVIDAHVLTYDGEDAIYEIFLWISGKFVFYSHPVQRPKTIKRLTEDLIITGIRYDERWRKLCRMGINSKTIFKAKSKEEIARMIAQEEEGTVHLAQADQEFLQIADGKKNLGEIANQLGYNRRKTVTILSFLLTNNFIDIISNERPSGHIDDISPPFLNEIG